MSKYWETQSGEDIEYKKLKDSHLLNILKWIERRAENGMTVEVGGSGCCADDMLYDSWEIRGDEVLEKYNHKGLLKEVKRRKLKLTK